MFERYSRQMLFPPIGEEGQKKLAQKRVLVVGVGALGTVVSNHLVRAGVGYVKIVDRDYVEKSNLQRQMLFDEDDVKNALPKAIAAKEKLQKINSDVTIDASVIDVTSDNIESLVEGMDIVLDGTDNFATRFLINDICFKKGIPYVYGGVVSSRGMSALFIPNKTPCLRCFIKEGDSAGETCDTVGVISPIVDIVASLEVVEALKYLVGDEENIRKSLLTLNIWNHHIYELRFTTNDPECPTCSKKEYPALLGHTKQEIVSLCGRDTVQIHMKSSFSLEEWEKKLQKVLKVQLTPFLLRAETDEGYKLVLFPDGRVLVQGTEDLTVARTLYAKYIGS